MKLNKIINACKMAVLALGGFVAACTSEDILPVMPEISISSDTVTAAEAGGTFDVVVDASDIWQVTECDSYSWASLSVTEGEAGKTTVTVNVEAQNSEADDARVASYLFHIGAVSTKLTVIQSGKPVVVTIAASDLGTSSAVLNASWHFALDAGDVSTGFEYRVKGEDQWNSVASGQTDKGAFGSTLEGLQTTDYDPAKDAGGVTYEYRAYVESSKYGRIYGETLTFTTVALPKLVSVSAIRALYSGSDLSLKPYRVKLAVVSDPSAGNSVFTHAQDLQEGTAEGNGIALILPDGVSYAAGTMLDIDLTSCVLAKSAARDIFSPVLGITIADAACITTGEKVELKAAQLSSAKEIPAYESQLVSIAATQLTPIYSDQTKFPTWGSKLYMETYGSEVTYALGVRAEAAFADKATSTGSGTLTGIAATASDGSTPMVAPRNEGDLAGLTAERFESLLAFKFTGVQFVGTMFKGDKNEGCYLRISYQNATEGTVISALSASMTGALAGLTVETLENYELAPGSGTIKLSVTGTPEAGGDVTFTVTGLEEYGFSGDKAAVTVEVGQLPSGNFTVLWNPTGMNANTGGKPDLPVESNTSDKVTVSAMVATGFTASKSYKNTWGGAKIVGNTVESPSAYATFTITTSTTLSLYSFDMNLRKNANGYKYMTVQCSVAGGAFTTIFSIADEEAANSQKNFVQDVSKVKMLQNIPAGTKLEFRLIPTGAIADDGTWCVNAPGFSINGQAD